MGSLRLILGLAVALVVVSFGVINMQPVSVAYSLLYYRGTLQVPLFYVLLGVFTAGFLVAWLGGLFDRIRFYRRMRGIRRQVRSLESEVARVREQSGRLLAAARPDPAEDSSHAPPDSAPQTSALSPGADSGPGSPKQEGQDVPAR